MKPIHSLLLLLYLLIGTLSYGQDSETRQLAEFDRIKILDNATVYLHIGTPQSVRVEAKTPLNGIRTEVEDGVLEIHGPPSVIYITTPSIRSIGISGIGKVECDSTLTASSLRINVSGSGKVNLPVSVGRLEIGISGMGKVNLSGAADKAEINISGSGKIEASKLKVKSCEAHISGIGKCYIDVTESLDMHVSGSGAIYYKTKPANLTANISGIGKYGVMKTEDDDDNDTSSRNSSTGGGESGSTTVVGHSSYNNDDDDDYSFHWDSDSIFHMPEKARSHWGGIDFGVNQLMYKDNFSTTLPDGYNFLELNSGKSINVNVNIFYHDFPLYKRYLMFTTGAGLTLNNYRFSDNRTLIADTNRVLASYDYDNNGNQIKYEKNKLAVNYVTVPLLLQWNSREKFDNSFHIAAGLLLSYKFNSHLKLVYKEDGDREKTKRQDEFNIEPFRYDLTLRLGYEYYTLYASYAMNSLFKDGKGPELHPFQVGVNLFGW